jgi:hypothetical protein
MKRKRKREESFRKESREKERNHLGRSQEAFKSSGNDIAYPLSCRTH